MRVCDAFPIGETDGFWSNMMAMHWFARPRRVHDAVRYPTVSACGGGLGVQPA